MPPLMSTLFPVSVENRIAESPTVTSPVDPSGEGFGLKKVADKPATTKAAAPLASQPSGCASFTVRENDTAVSLLAWANPRPNPLPPAPVFIPVLEYMVCEICRPRLAPCPSNPTLTSRLSTSPSPVAEDGTTIHFAGSLRVQLILC